MTDPYNGMLLRNNEQEQTIDTFNNRMNVKMNMPHERSKACTIIPLTWNSGKCKLIHTVKRQISGHWDVERSRGQTHNGTRKSGRGWWKCSDLNSGGGLMSIRSCQNYGTPHLKEMPFIAQNNIFLKVFAVKGEKGKEQRQPPTCFWRLQQTADLTP